MNKKLLCIIPIVFLLLSVQIVYATYTKTFNYTIFNSTTVTKYALDKTYDKAWTTKILIHLKYNETTASNVKIRLNATSEYIEVIPKFDGNYDVWLKEGEASPIKINGVLGTWEQGKPIYLSFDKTYLNVGNKTDRDGVVDDYALGNWDLTDVGGYGDTDVCESGYVTVEVDVGIGVDVTSWIEMIYEFLPAIITFAVLGALLGAVTKAMGKW